MEFCPQCQRDIGEVFLETLIQDACGHKKCRQCLIKEKNECKACSKHTVQTSVSIFTGVSPEVEAGAIEPGPTRQTSDRSIQDLTTDDEKMITTLENAVTLPLKYKKNSCEQTQLSVHVAHETQLPSKKKVPKKCISRSSNTSKCKMKRKPLCIPGFVTISETTPKFTCTICKKSFTSRLHIRYHLYCDGTSKPYRCDKCNQEFITKSHYQYHIRNHEGSRPYVCRECGKAFNQQGKLTRHIRCHLDEKTFICSTCGHGFKNLDGLKSHFRTHSGVKPHLCTLCNMRFSELTNLKKHSITHTGEKNFMCDECGKSFGSKSTLNSHILIHTKEKPHICNSCGRAFISRKDLKRHETTHLSLKPFICQICNQSFRRKDNFDRHMKNTHPESNLPPIIHPLPTVNNAQTVPSPTQEIFDDKAHIIDTIELSVPKQACKIDLPNQKSSRCKSEMFVSGLKSCDKEGNFNPQTQIKTGLNIPTTYTPKKRNKFYFNAEPDADNGKNVLPASILRPGSEVATDNGQTSIVISVKDIDDSLPRPAIYQAVPVINRTTFTSLNKQSIPTTSSIIKMGTSIARTAHDGTNCVRTITCTSNVRNTIEPPNVPTIVCPMRMKQTESSPKTSDKPTNQDHIISGQEKINILDTIDCPPKPKLRLYLSDLHWRKRTMELLNLRNELKADSLVYDKSLEKVDDIEEETNLNSSLTRSERIEFCNSPKNNNPDDHGTYYSKQTFYKVSDQPGEILVRDTQQKYLPHNRLRHIHPKSIDYHDPHQQSSADPRNSLRLPNRADSVDRQVQHSSILQLHHAPVSHAKNVIVENKTGNLRRSS